LQENLKILKALLKIKKNVKKPKKNDVVFINFLDINSDFLL